MRWLIILIGLVGAVGCVQSERQDLPGESWVIHSEFIFQEAPFAQCHASTIVESRFGLVAAWFGGTREKHEDVGIWLSRRVRGKWSKPVEVANGVQHNRKRYPCWNPVLFQAKNGLLLLFYKVGPNPREWWGMLMTSNDGGRSWSAGRRLPEDILGPVKNKPIQLSDGVLLCPSSSEDDGWRVHFEFSADLGETWELVGPIHDGQTFAAIQPTILSYPDGRLQALCRSRQGRIVETWSADAGQSWSEIKATALPNPNAGIDGVTLRDGRQLLVYNHTTQNRSPLNVALSFDGKSWHEAAVLETDPGEYSYPAVVQSSDGLVHITYTWKRRRIKHVTLDPARLEISAK